MRKRRFSNFVQLREVFPQADQVGKFTVFDIGGNKVRLIAESNMSVAELEKVTKAWPPLSRAVRVPHTETDYRELVELLDRITDEVGEDENHPLASLMDVLGVLIQKYEDEHVPELIE